MSIQSELAQLEGAFEAEWKKVEGGIEQFAETEVPILEADVEGAIAKWGADTIGLVVRKLASGLSPHETVSEAADSIIQAAEKDGVTILNSTARAAGSQIVVAGQTKLASMLAAPKS